jgi:hypothetical protein
MCLKYYMNLLLNVTIDFPHVASTFLVHACDSGFDTGSNRI